MGSLENQLKQKKFENEQIKANINILYTANWLYNKISTRLKPFNLTHEQFNVLRILKGSHPNCMPQKDILSRMIAPSSNLTLIIKKLKDKDLIELKNSSKDKREYEIIIKNSGLKLLNNINNQLMKDGPSISNLSDEEAFQLNNILDKLREN